MMMRMLGWVALPAAVFALTAAGSWTVAGQERPGAPSGSTATVRHSEQMKITERFRRVADDIIQYQATFDDPLTYERPFTISFPLTPLDGGVLLPYDCHPGNTAISMSLAAERLEDRRHAEDLANGIIRPRRGVQDCGAGIGSAPVPGCAEESAAGGRGTGPLPEGAATGERDQER